MLVNFINENRHPIHEIIGLFKVYNVVGVGMVNKIKSLLGYFGLLDKIITHVKDEGYNLQSLTTTLTFCGVLVLH
jgi:hypothetical protein